MKVNPYLNPSLLASLSLIITFSFFTTPSHQSSNPTLPPNPRLQQAYIALQAWKHTIISDPKSFTSNWNTPFVCNYTGVYCAPALDNPNLQTVAGIDLNHADISGTLPELLGLLTDLSLFHINSNRFSGTLPESFQNLHLLYELDISNNQFSGHFPYVVLSLPSLKFLDIRFNEFEGNIPSSLFDLKLDALFINNNHFQSSLPENIGNSPVSVLVLANNNLNGCFPASITKMGKTLTEIIISNAGLVGCLATEIGLLKGATVFDVSFNKLSGSLPESMGGMESLEQLNVAHNKLSGEIPANICSLPRLENFTYSDNYFCGEPAVCLKLADKDDRENCIAERPFQRSVMECKAFYSNPVDCGGCLPTSPPPPRSTPPPPLRPRVGFYHHP